MKCPTILTSLSKPFYFQKLSGISRTNNRFKNVSFWHESFRFLLRSLLFDSKVVRHIHASVKWGIFSFFPMVFSIHSKAITIEGGQSNNFPDHCYSGCLIHFDEHWTQWSIKLISLNPKINILTTRLTRNLFVELCIVTWWIKGVILFPQK